MRRLWDAVIRRWKVRRAGGAGPIAPLVDPSFDAASSASSNSGTSLSWNHTVGASGNYLVVAVVHNYDEEPFVRVDGEPMYVIDVVDRDQDTQFYQTWLFGYPVSPGVRSLTFTVRSTSGFMVAGGVSLIGVDGSKQYGSVSTPTVSAGSGTATATVARGEHELVLGVCVNGQAAQTATPGGNQTERVNVANAANNVRLNMTTSLVDSNTWTLGASVGWETVAVSLKPTGANGVKPLPGKRLWSAAMSTGGAVFRALVESHYSSWVGNGRPDGHPVADADVDYFVADFLNSLGYYDGVQVHRHIGEYLDDDDHRTASQHAADIQVDGYIEPKGGALAGFNHFERGLAQDYLDYSGDLANKEAVLLLRDNAAYSAFDDPSYTPMGDHIWLMRETAYALNAHVWARRLGYADMAGGRFADLVDYGYQMLSDIFITRTATVNVTGGDIPTEANGQWYAKPFMVGLLCRALIEEWEDSGDGRAVSHIQAAADFMFEHMWDDQELGFHYYNFSLDGTADPIVLEVTAANFTTFTYADPPQTFLGVPVNSLIGPIYYWLANRLGDDAYIERGDRVLQGISMYNRYYDGVSKLFNQAYTWSIQGVEWRAQRLGG